MKVTVCELSNDRQTMQYDWQALVHHVREENSSIVLLPEMAFHPWVAHTRQFDPMVWRSAVEAHDRWLPRLTELQTSLVIGSRPVIQDDSFFNEGFIWDRRNGYRPVHRKYYLPDEDGFWEASWYRRGPKTFNAVKTAMGTVGFLICTELWFTSHARDYARQDVDLLVCPRATPLSSADKWVAGGRAAAVVSGAYCLSSNFGGTCQGVAFGGTGWVIEPEEGHVLGITTPQEPFLTMDINLTAAKKAKVSYPRYVAD